MVEFDNNTMGTSVYLLVKFGKKEHLLQMQEEGRICMRSLKDFMDHEHEHPRGDRNEGLSSLHQAENVEVKISSPRGQLINLNKDNGLIGQVKIAFNGYRSLKVFCLLAISNPKKKPLIDPRNFKFGDSALVIANVREFIRRFEKSAEEAELRLTSGLVEYIDEKKHNGEMGPFRKFKHFSYQDELRFAAWINSDSPYFLNIGSISDISHIFDSEMLAGLTLSV